MPKISLYLQNQRSWLYWVDQLAGDRSKVGLYAKEEGVDPFHPEKFPCTVCAEFDHHIPAWFVTFVRGKTVGMLR